MWVASCLGSKAVPVPSFGQMDFGWRSEAQAPPSASALASTIRFFLRKCFYFYSTGSNFFFCFYFFFFVALLEFVVFGILVVVGNWLLVFLDGFVADGFGFYLFFFLVNANRVRGFESELKATTRGYTERYTGEEALGPSERVRGGESKAGLGLGSAHTVLNLPNVPGKYGQLVT